MSHSGSRRRRRSRRRRQLRRMRIAAAVTALFAILATGWLVIPRHDRSLPIADASDWAPNTAAPDYAALAARIKVPHHVNIHHYPVFNYSVVRGGVHSVEELRQAVAHDRAVAQHYAKFQYERARLVRLRKPALVYLSYSMNGRIYWTRDRHRLNAGEELITDGAISARTKCANQLSTRKQLAVSPEEPPAAALEQVEPPPLLPPAQTTFPVLYKQSLLTPGPEPAPWTGPRLGPVFPLVGPPLPRNPEHHKPVCPPGSESTKPPCNPHHHKPPAAVPEPSTWLLLVSGLAVVGFGVYRNRKFAGRTMIK